ncbi:hypothetical protein [uncultured Eudoraea sp.]|uniref:hypothetical protein n=1 Tax=uncultured Eudoraea sp. TaxID=1035614 RepID=UPI0026332FA2|nr:hypothetical protein [uncultured Eudoraea sp.]
MKTTTQILMLMAVISFMSCGQLHVVTLYVDTEAIPSPPLPSKSSIDQYANFGQPAGVANKDYATIVRKGDLIIWRGESISNPEHVVKITSIDHYEGEEIIKLKPFNTIMRKDGPVAQIGSNELVRAKVILKPGKEEAYIREEYILTFTVSNKTGTFTIDPEVQGHKKK